jgi:hypothetical protein
MSPIRVLVIPIDGPVRFEQVQPDLASMQHLVEGDIEGIGYREGATCYGNGDGKFSHGPNPRAHDFLVKHFRHNAGDQIHGPVVILGCDEDEGSDIDLPTDLAFSGYALFEQG